MAMSLFHIVNFEFDSLIMFFLCVFTFDQVIYRFSLLIVRLERNVKLFSLLQILQKLIYIIVALGLCYTIKENYLLLLVIATVVSYFVCMVVSIIAQKSMWNFKTVDVSNCISISGTTFLIETKEILHKKKVEICISKRIGMKVRFNDKWYKIIPISMQNKKSLKSNESVEAIIENFVYFYCLKNERLSA